MKPEFDVIIVGGGGSGLAAAVSAAEHGASVLVLEKHAQLGGATGIAVGSLTANRTRMQANAGVQDSLDDHAEDAGLFARPEIEARNNPEMRRWFLDHSAETLHWLMEMGLNFYGPNPEPPNRVPRMHNVIPGAKAYITVLQARLIKLGGTVITDAHVLDLILGDGRVTGVEADVGGERRVFSATTGVVLAAGDYANSPALISRFKGEQFAHIEGVSERAAGDGHLAGRKGRCSTGQHGRDLWPRTALHTVQGQNLSTVAANPGTICKADGDGCSPDATIPDEHDDQTLAGDLAAP